MGRDLGAYLGRIDGLFITMDDVIIDAVLDEGAGIGGAE